MAVSSRRLAVVDTPIIPTIAALVRAHPGTISLGQGVVSYGPPIDLAEALLPMAADPSLHKYQAVSGLPELAQALRAKLADNNGIGDQARSALMVSAGSNMAFLQAAMAVSDPGDEFILPSPYYFNQEMALRMIGCQPVPVPTDARHQLDPDRVAAAITPRTRAVITVSPNNPSGAVYPQETLTAVNALCARHGIYHFSDEAYEAFCFAGARHFSPGSLPGAGEHTLSFFSFSKSHGMASWRVGYCLYPAALEPAMLKIQDTNLICAPVASQLVALASLRAGSQAIAGQLQALAAVRETVHGQLARLEGLARFEPTEGAFYVLVALPAVADPVAYNRRMVESYGVATIPGFAFGLDPAQANWQRLSYGALDGAAVLEGTRRFVDAVTGLAGVVRA